MTVPALNKTRPTLGRGLSALLGENLPPNSEQVLSNDIEHLEVNLLRPGKYQPRQNFNDQHLELLIASIREKGIIQPLIVRPIEFKDNNISSIKTSTYEIIAGERRWRAS